MLLALDNLGFEIKPLLAGLGIGGIAVALAVQTVLGDLLASMSIALDKPFTVGDSLQVDDINGTVEHIGVKSTRLRSVSGEQVIISNADILKSRVRNNGRMRERRSAFVLNVPYGTEPDKLRAIPPAVRDIVETQPRRALRPLPSAHLRGLGAAFRSGVLHDGRRTTRPTPTCSRRSIWPSWRDSRRWASTSRSRPRRRPRLQPETAAS